MNNNIEIIPLFATAIYKSNILLTDEFIMQSDNIEYVRYVSDDGYHSRDCNVLNSETFSSLIPTINEHLENYTRGLLKIDKKIQFGITTSWLSKHDKFDISPKHRHENSVFSGIIYLRTPPNCGGLLFSSENTNWPSTFSFDVNEYNTFNSHRWKFNPQPGDIFLFPSTLFHSTEKNLSDDIRTCLVFNVFVKGDFGVGISSLTL